jgi:hypothetical protein
VKLERGSGSIGADLIENEDGSVDRSINRFLCQFEIRSWGNRVDRFCYCRKTGWSRDECWERIENAVTLQDAFRTLYYAVFQVLVRLIVCTFFCK